MSICLCLGVYAYVEQVVTINAQRVDASADASKVKVIITSPSGKKANAKIDIVGDKLYEVSYMLSEEGIILL